MREFKVEGTQFLINGATTFLRGKHDACVFPLTGYPPMDVDGWLRLYNITKDYGINHYRFHSWCPPEAAFKAADIAGIYLQPELPVWWSFKADNPDHISFMMKEGYNIFDNYGNHASFVMFALGNEIYQDRDTLKKMISNFRSHDNRFLFAQGSNNRGANPSQAEGDDYWTTFRTASEKEDCGNDVRASISFLDSKEGGVINTMYPSTSFTYSAALKNSTIPVIGHESGQYSIYPDYNEMKKYTGVLEPRNFALFRNRLAANNMLDQADDFFKASGELSAICYRAEIETAIRTPGFAGFQLLDLQDYPGQGTALVGLLDAFMESKGIISPEEFRQFCSNTVILLIMDKYCWENNETFNAAVQLANYSNEEIDVNNVKWALVEEAGGQTIDSGDFAFGKADQGGITSLGNIRIDLSSIATATKAKINLEIPNTPYKTNYPLWIYPARKNILLPPEIKSAKVLDDKTEQMLMNGEKVLLFPDFAAIEKNSVPSQFIPEFWNYGMFKGFAEQWGGQVSPGTMGLLIDTSHKIFENFPTEFYTNWQWWTIIKNSRPIILDNSNKNYRPVVQVIDNINRNHKMGLIFEYKVGPGKLLVCAPELMNAGMYPEARQLYSSVINYMISDEFNPSEEILFDDLKKVILGK